jgi:sulfur dioxygenase
MHAEKHMTQHTPLAPIQLFDQPSGTYTYIVSDPTTREAIIIDPVEEQIERDMAILQEYKLTLRYAIETHAHADHITSAAKLVELTGAKTGAPANCGITTASIQLAHGDTLTVGSESLTALHTPGHTGGSMCFVWRDNVFTGDTLLINGCGRTDFQSGSASDLYDSIQTHLFSLPDATTVWPGHDYQGRTHTTIGFEKQNNQRLANKTASEFIAIMDGLNLPRPKRIDEAVPANLTSGVRHDAGDHQKMTSPVAAQGYAGDVSGPLAWAWVSTGEAVLVDVRTDAEREWVGYVPGAVAVAYKQWPNMQENADFDAQMKAASGGKKVVLLCRSGVRSIAAAKRATALGMAAYNILEGFEGDPDTSGHRGTRGGWRARGLPWRQN